MKATISIPPSLAYGADEVVPTTTVGQDVNDALYLTVHGYPGGVTALAARLGMSPNTLTHKVNVNNKTHHLSPIEVMAIMTMSGNATALHAMAAQMNYTCTAAIPDQSGGDAVEAFMHLQRAFGNAVCAVADPLARGEAVSRNEMRRAEAMAGDLQAALAHVLAALRGHMRTAPQELP